MSAPDPDEPSRIDALEIRIAYQDEAIETLNRAVTEQWRLIDELRRELARLQDRVQQAEDRAAAGPATPEPPPPHY